VPAVLLGVALRRSAAAVAAAGTAGDSRPRPVIEMSLRCRACERRDALVALGVLLVSANRVGGAAGWCGPVDFRFLGELEWSTRRRGW
jgi:hypothetical protein